MMNALPVTTFVPASPGKFSASGRLGIWLLLFLAVFSSCKKDKIAQVTAVPALTASSSTVVLSSANAAQPAVTFTWSAANVSGMNGAVTYFLQWDIKGNNFANPTDIKLGRDTLKKSYTQSALNDVLSTLPTGVASQIELRIVSATSDGSVAPFYSNAISLTVTTYSKAIPPPYSQLWVIGDATPNGWDINNPTPLLQDGTDPYIFTLTVNLTAGEFKIATAKDFNAAFYRPTVNHPALSDTKVQVSAGEPDNKWQITKASKYKIVLNLHTMTITIVDQNVVTAPPPYSKLWIVGDATPAGWDINNPTPMVQDAGNPFVFTYTGALTAGEFKIPVATGDWGAKFYRPVTNHPALTDTQVVLLDSNSGDFKWQITDAGNYKVTLDLSTLTITIVKQ